MYWNIPQLSVANQWSGRIFAGIFAETSFSGMAIDPVAVRPSVGPRAFQSLESFEASFLTELGERPASDVSGLLVSPSPATIPTVTLTALTKLERLAFTAGSLESLSGYETDTNKYFMLAYALVFLL